MSINDLLLESNQERRNMGDPSQTSNIINAIPPLSVKGALCCSSSYLRSFMSERHDVSITEMDHIVRDHLLSITRAKGKNMVERYDRGVRWDIEHVDPQGSHWVTIYLSMWLYSYCQPGCGPKHFVAVSDQSGKMMGSVLTNRVMLYPMTFLIFIIDTTTGLILFVTTL